MSNFPAQDNKELKLFYARLDDLEKRALSGAVSHSDFFTPSEIYKAEKYFEAKGNKDKICFFGGFFDSQRKQIFLLPEYLVDAYDKNELVLALDDDFNASITVLKICGSGFRRLSHRDYLGSILSLGVERDKIGDICVLNDSSAIVFCSGEVSDFLIMELVSIGSDRVKIERTSIDKNMPSTQQYQGFADTVASERIDCIVASIFNLSREKAQNLIKGGFVEFNYEVAKSVDERVNAGDIISARGYGKFVIRDVSCATKKGRLRLLADRYI